MSSRGAVGDTMAKRHSPDPPAITVTFADFDDDQVIEAIAEALLRLVDDGTVDRLDTTDARPEPRDRPAVGNAARKRPRR
jgi:hypothetical protein